MGLSIDRERVIRGTEICLSGGLPQRCIECPYHNDGCDRQRMIDTLKLLNEQEAKTILDIADSIEGIEVGKCPRCERTIVNKQNDPTWFCKFCGQAVRWK